MVLAYRCPNCEEIIQITGGTGTVDDPYIAHHDCELEEEE